MEDDTARGLKAERQTGRKKGEWMIWIWVKRGGNSQGEMISTENVWLGLTKKEISVFGVLLYHLHSCNSDKKRVSLLLNRIDIF